MTALQRLQIRGSEIRQRLNELAGTDELTDELRAESDRLVAELADVETRTRAAIAAEEEREAEAAAQRPDAEERERQRLRAETSVQDFAAAAVAGRAPAGAAAEYRESVGVPEVGPGGGIGFPLAMLAPPGEHRTETDVDTVTTAQPWLDRLFAGTGSMHLGITRRAVAPGRASYPSVTAGATPAQRGRDEAAAVAAWTVAAGAAEPKRVASALNVAGADMIRLPGLEDALTRDLRAGLVERMDRIVILGDTGADENSADIAGLSGSTLATTVQITQAAKVLFAGNAGALAGMLDGIHAMEPGELHALVSVPALTLWGSTLVSTNGERTILRALREEGYMLMSRDGIDTGTADGDAGGFVARQRGIMGAAVHSVWEAGELIRDMYTGAREGQTRLTLSAYHDFTVVRASNFVPIEFDA